MELIETTIFSRQVQAALSAEEYRELQLHIVSDPNAGALIPGSGGLRKLRWGMENRGKSGGVRVIYYWRSAAGQIFLLYLYPKNVLSTLSPSEIRTLRRLIADD